MAWGLLAVSLLRDPQENQQMEPHAQEYRAEGPTCTGSKLGSSAELNNLFTRVSKVDANSRSVTPPRVTGCDTDTGWHCATAAPGPLQEGHAG